MIRFAASKLIKVGGKFTRMSGVMGDKRMHTRDHRVMISFLLYNRSVLSTKLMEIVLRR